MREGDTVADFLSPSLSPGREVRLRAGAQGRRHASNSGMNWRQKQSVQAVARTSLGVDVIADETFQTEVNAAGTVVIGPVVQGSAADLAELIEGDVVIASLLPHCCLTAASPLRCRCVAAASPLRCRYLTATSHYHCCCTAASLLPHTAHCLIC